MPGIYERDQINYGGMLGNAMAAKANYLKNRYDRVADIGRTWGNAVSNSGKAIQNVLNQYAQQQHQAEQNALNREDVLRRAREQQAWQAEQNRLQRESTENIARLNREAAIEQQKAEKQAQNMLNFNNAEAGLEYAKQAVDAANKSGDTGKKAIANRDLQIAQNKYDYYKNLVPFDANVEVDQDAVNEELLKQMTTEPSNEVQQNQAVKLSDLKAIKTLNDEKTKQDVLKSIEENPNFGQDKDLQDQYNRIKEIKTKEQAEAEAKAKLEKADKEFQSLDMVGQDEYLEEHKEYTVKDGHLKYKGK